MKTKRFCEKINSASAGNRTRIYCLEGNNANLYTTDAEQWAKNNWPVSPIFLVSKSISTCPNLLDSLRIHMLTRKLNFMCKDLLLIRFLTKKLCSTILSEL